MTDTAAPDPPRHPIVEAPARVTRADGCLGFFVGTLIGGITVAAWVSGIAAGIIVSAAAVFGVASTMVRARSEPAWGRLSRSILIGVVLVGLVFGLCVAAVSNMGNMH